MLPLNTVIQGNCLEVLKTFAGQSVDFVMTSPPYYGLRVYGKESTSLVWDAKLDCQHQWVQYVRPPGGGHSTSTAKVGATRKDIQRIFNAKPSWCASCGAWRGQLGLEPTWQMYVGHMRLICGEIRRVLKKSGSFYLVVGDTFAGSHCAHGDKTLFQNSRRIRVADNLYGKPSPQAKAVDYEPKCLMGIPWRVAFALVEDEWILRNAIIWHKPNAMPSSVKDRLAQTYEYIFHLVKSNRYYYNLDAVREQHKTSSIKRAGPSGIVPFNLRVRDIKRGKMGVTAFGHVTASEKEVQGYKSKYTEEQYGQTLQGLVRDQTQFQERLDSRRLAKEMYPNDPQKQQEYINYIHDHAGNPLGKNPGDVISLQPEGHGHDRWAGQRGEGLRPWQERFHPHGKNPGDVLYSLDGRGLETNVGEKGKLVEKKDQWRPRTRLLRLDGKNPGDVLKLNSVACPSGPQRWEREGTNRVEARFHPKGKNPGDVLRIGVHHGSSVITGRATYYEKQKIESDSEGKNPGDFWSITTKGFKGHHYAVYPERICVRPILAACPPDGIVLDPMAGSGTTLVVAKKLGRKWIAIELNPDYVPIIKRRLSTVPEKLDSFFK